MRGFRILIPGVVLLFALSGCKKDTSVSSQERKTASEEQSRKETDMGLSLKWLGHASFRISYEDTVVYIDPWKLKDAPKDADLVLVSHSHYDHYSHEDVNNVLGVDTKLVASNDVIVKEGIGQAIMPGLTLEFGDVRVQAVPAYNPNKQFHPKSNQWIGFVVEIGGKRIYYAGDTDITEEMKALKDIDVALLPVGGTYTMNASEAAEATGYIKPKLAIPYHWGDIVGGESDAKSCAEKADCKVTVLHPGESISL